MGVVERCAPEWYNSRAIEHLCNLTRENISLTHSLYFGIESVQHQQFSHPGLSDPEDGVRGSLS